MLQNDGPVEAAARLGKSAVVIEPGRHVGGLSSGGLGATDIGNKKAIGGIAREFYGRIGRHYGQEEAWTFEPHVAEETFRGMAREAGIAVVFGERLDLKDGVAKDGGRIVAITMESGRRFEGRVFIDATYEGDLMAKAGVSYHVGREANSVYGETLNGVQTKNAKYHQFECAIDPYVVEGEPSSGLLPGIQEGGPGEEGSGDRRVALRAIVTIHQGWTLDCAEAVDGDAEQQDRHEQQGGVCQRQHWHELRLPGRRLCGSRADL